MAAEVLSDARTLRLPEAVDTIPAWEAEVAACIPKPEENTMTDAISEASVFIHLNFIFKNSSYYIKVVVFRVPLQEL